MRKTKSRSKKAAFSPDTRNPGGRSVITQQMYNHYNALLNAKSTIKLEGENELQISQSNLKASAARPQSGILTNPRKRPSVSRVSSAYNFPLKIPMHLIHPNMKMDTPFAMGFQYGQFRGRNYKQTDHVSLEHLLNLKSHYRKLRDMGSSNNEQIKRLHSPYVKPALFFKDASASYDNFNVAHAPRIFLVDKQQKRSSSKGLALKKAQREKEEAELQRQLMMQYLAQKEASGNQSGSDQEQIKKKKKILKKKRPQSAYVSQGKPEISDIQIMQYGQAAGAPKTSTLKRKIKNKKTSVEEIAFTSLKPPKSVKKLKKKVVRKQPAFANNQQSSNFNQQHYGQEDNVIEERADEYNEEEEADFQMERDRQARQDKKKDSTKKRVEQQEQEKQAEKQLKIQQNKATLNKKGQEDPNLLIRVEEGDSVSQRIEKEVENTEDYLMDKRDQNGDYKIDVVGDERDYPDFEHLEQDDQNSYQDDEENGQVYIENDDMGVEDYDYQEKLEKLANYSDQGVVVNDLFTSEKIDFDAIREQKRKERLAREAQEAQENERRQQKQEEEEKENIHEQLARDEAMRIQGDLGRKQVQPNQQQSISEKYGVNYQNSDDDEKEYAQMEPEDYEDDMEYARYSGGDKEQNLIEEIDIDVPEIDPNAVNLEEEDDEVRDSAGQQNNKRQIFQKSGDEEEEFENQEEEGQEEELNEEMLQFYNEIPRLEEITEESVEEFKEQLLAHIVKYQIFNSEEFDSLFQATHYKNQNIDYELLENIFDQVSETMQQQLEELQYEGDQEMDGEYVQDDQDADAEQYDDQN